MTPTTIQRQPSEPELRMLGAVVRQSICDAWQCGEDRAAFRGYRIETRRIEACGHGHPLFVLTLSDASAGRVLYRLFIAVASHPIPGSALRISFDGARLGVAPDRVSRWLCQPV